MTSGKMSQSVMAMIKSNGGRPPNPPVRRSRTGTDLKSGCSKLLTAFPLAFPQFIPWYSDKLFLIRPLLGRSRKSSLSGASPDPYGGNGGLGTPMSFGRSPITPGSSGGGAGAHRSRPRAGVTHSQPGSRSTSPSSLRSYQTYGHQHHHQQHHADTVGEKTQIS